MSCPARVIFYRYSGDRMSPAEVGSRMKRRGFLEQVVNGASTLALCSSPAAALLAEASAEGRTPTDYSKTPYRGDGFGAFSIIQGITGPTSTQVNVVLPKTLVA